MRAAIALGFLICALPAWGQQAKAAGMSIDIAKMSCKDLMSGNDADRDAGIAYYHGYFAGKKNSSVIDVRVLAEQTDRVTDYCLSNPNSAVVDAFAKTAK
jgi:HdeA/HdeB family